MKEKELASKILAASNKIHKSKLSGSANYLITSSNVANFIRLFERIDRIDRMSKIKKLFKNI